MNIHRNCINFQKRLPNIYLDDNTKPFLLLLLSLDYNLLNLKIIIGLNVTCHSDLFETHVHHETKKLII